MTLAPEAPSAEPIGGPNSRGSHVGLLIASTLVIVASVFMNIRGHDRVRLLGFSELPQMCQFRNIFDIPCPGCGLTRAFISMGHLDFVSAWNYHPIGVFFYAIVVFQIPYRCIQIVRCRNGLLPIQLGTAPPWIWGILVAAVFVQWILRVW